MKFIAILREITERNKSDLSPDKPASFAATCFQGQTKRKTLVDADLTLHQIAHANRSFVESKVQP